MSTRSYLAWIIGHLFTFRNGRSFGSGNLLAGVGVVVDGLAEEVAGPLLAVVDEEEAAALVDDVAVLLAGFLLNVLHGLDKAFQLNRALVQGVVLLNIQIVFTFIQIISILNIGR